MKHLKIVTQQHLYFVGLKTDEIPNTAPVHLDMSGYDAKVVLFALSKLSKDYEYKDDEKTILQIRNYLAKQIKNNETL